MFIYSVLPGILLHYATPALNHLYFVDPQWLCDMLAHVVTVPEVNNFVQRGSGVYNNWYMYMYVIVNSCMHVYCIPLYNVLCTNMYTCIVIILVPDLNVLHVHAHSYNNLH